MSASSSSSSSRACAGEGRSSPSNMDMNRSPGKKMRVRYMQLTVGIVIYLTMYSEQLGDFCIGIQLSHFCIVCPGSFPGSMIFIFSEPFHRTSNIGIY
jgi:hypothetical protein